MYQFSKRIQTFTALCVFAIHGCGDALGSEPPLAVPTLTGFDTISSKLWDETAVRKVLNTFAYGGHATNAQITKWADLRPRRAIVQMLTFDQHNLLLSPINSDSNDVLDSQNGTLIGLAQFWASDDPDNLAQNKQRYNLFGDSGQAQRVWTQAATTRGLNPFRQKIGLWETNYHLATNMSVVNRRVMASYYDAILTALEAGLPYQAVMTEAAKSAAVAIQYGHRKNFFVDGICRCNEDFAREYHQLFFGILGIDDSEYHETVTIKNTAAALTDMVVVPDLEYGGWSDTIEYGTEKHTPGTLEILQVGIGGNNAAQRINILSDYAIEHSESLANLPVKIISDLADDNLTDQKIAQIRMAWQSMDEKNLLDFIRAYAISTLFHDASRIKYRTSIDRHLLITNHLTLKNSTSYLNIYAPLLGYESEGVRAFYPTHNVFGSQTGAESINSAITFQNNFSRVTEGSWRFTRTNVSRDSLDWEKDWASAIPQSASGGYAVIDVAEWLWQHFVSDGLKNFGVLERAHLYALLGKSTDLAYLVNSGDEDRVITSVDIQTDPVIIATVEDLSQQVLTLDSPDIKERRKANQRIGQAVNFIVGSPFMFIEEGR